MINLCAAHTDGRCRPTAVRAVSPFLTFVAASGPGDKFPDLQAPPTYADVLWYIECVKGKDVHGLGSSSVSHWFHLENFEASEFL